MLKTWFATHFLGSPNREIKNDHSVSLAISGNLPSAGSNTAASRSRSRSSAGGSPEKDMFLSAKPTCLTSARKTYLPPPPPPRPPPNPPPPRPPPPPPPLPATVSRSPQKATRKKTSMCLSSNIRFFVVFCASKRDHN